MWFLHDRENPTKAQGAFPEKIILYARIQNAIVSILADIGADAAAKDAARYIRIPGSFNTKGEEYVRWELNLDPDGNRRSYELTHLETFFRIAPPKRRERNRERVLGRPSIPNRRKGWTALNQRRLGDFDALRSLRGGFAEGCRNYAAFLFAWLLRCTGVDRNEATKMVAKLGAECRPRLAAHECKDAIKSGYANRMRSIKEATIEVYLRITSEETQYLIEHRTARRKESRIVAIFPTRAQGRRHAVLAIIEALGQAPSGRVMASILREQGHRVKHSQVAIDYRGLNVPTRPYGLPSLPYMQRRKLDSPKEP